MGKRLVLVGGGHAHALVLAAWAAKAPSHGDVVLVTPEDRSPYSGMLPGHLAGHYGRSAFHVDLGRLAARARARLVLARAAGLDLGAGRVQLDDGTTLPFDAVSLDTGSTSAPPPLPGAERIVPIKPLPPFLAAWDAFLAAPGPIVVLGGGLGGIELVLAMAHRLRGSGVGLTLVERGPAIAAPLPAGARRRLATALAAAGVTVRTGAAAVAVTGEGVTLADGSVVPATLVVAAVGARPAPWLATSGLALTADGFVRVGPHLRAVGDARVFAAGDVAHLDHAPREKAGVFAVRQGPVLARNLAAALTGGELADFAPQADYLRLVALGPKRALAVKYGLALGGLGPVGAGLWRLKDRIDRRFMAAVGSVAAP